MNRYYQRCCRTCYYFDWSTVYLPGSRFEGVCTWWEERWEQGEKVRGPIHPRPDHPACFMYQYNEAWRGNRELHRDIARQRGWM